MILSATALMLSGSAAAAVLPGDSSSWTQEPTVMSDGTVSWTGQSTLAKRVSTQDMARSSFAKSANRLATPSKMAVVNDAMAYHAVDQAVMAAKPAAQPMGPIQLGASVDKGQAMPGEAANLATTDEPMNGVGGPEVATSYPPCDPGPGDDNCIQLYERGVRADYAQWQQDRTGMGGPEESDKAMGADMSDMSKEAYWSALSGKLDAGKAEHDETAASLWGEPGTATHWAINQPVAPIRVETSFADDAEVARNYATAEQIRALSAIEMQQSDYTGMGGPEETDYYPVCRSDSDDRCIQPNG
jgi:hypothetical protein